MKTFLPRQNKRLDMTGEEWMGLTALASVDCRDKNQLGKL